MIRFLLAAIMLFVLNIQKLNAQHLYYKQLNKEIISQFADTSNKVVFKQKDSINDYTNYFKYVLKFFPKIEYEQIEIVFKPSSHIAKIKPTFMDFFRAPINRKYKIFFSNKCNSTLDSVTFNHLPINSQIGLIARQLGHIEDLSTDGFFSLLGWRWRQMFSKKRQKVEHENELNVLELGFGFQLLSLGKEAEEKLKIEKWKNAKAYTDYTTGDKNKFMTPENILNFIKDMPVYASQKFK